MIGRQFITIYSSMMKYIASLSALFLAGASAQNTTYPPLTGNFTTMSNFTTMPPMMTTTDNGIGGMESYCLDPMTLHGSCFYGSNMYDKMMGVMEKCMPEELEEYMETSMDTKAACPKFKSVMGKLKKQAAGSMEGCVVKALGWVNKKWVPNMKVHNADVMSLDSNLLAKLDMDAITKCKKKAVNSMKLMKTVKKCKKSYGKKNVKAFTDLANMIEGSKCFSDNFAPACKSFVMETYVVPLVESAFGMSSGNTSMNA